MSIQSKSKKVEVKTVSRAVCDNCQNELACITVYDENEKTSYHNLDDVEGHLDGIDLKFKAGYGTTYDMSDFQLTLCTNCLADMVKQFGGIIRQ